jgi:hypothetical protein
MVGKFMDAAAENLRVFCIEEDELVGVHRYPHLPFPDECPEGGKVLPEGVLPVGGADRMGGEGDEIRGDTKKEDPVIRIIAKNIFKAAEVFCYGQKQPLISVGPEAECPAAPAGERLVDARVSDFHVLPGVSVKVIRLFLSHIITPFADGFSETPSASWVSAAYLR